jgi:hypothetical protein
MDEKKVCGKCKGKGYLKNYAHVDGGRCYGCEGRGWTTSEKQASKRAEYLMTKSAAFHNLCDDYNSGKLSREDYRQQRNEIARKFGAEEIPAAQPQPKVYSGKLY